MVATSRSEGAAAVPRGAEPLRLRRYVAVGDSFTAGVPGDPESAGRWPDALAAALRQRHPDLDYHNLGVAGATSGEVSAGQLDRAAALEPDLVTVLCGANDVLLSVRPDIARYAETFDRMLDRLRLDGRLLVSATCADFSPWLPMGPRSRRRVSDGLVELNEVTRATAARYGATCLDLAAHAGAGERANYAADGVHPSALGNRRAAGAFAAAIDDLVADRTQTREEGS